MKARTSLAAVIALMAFPAFAQEPPATTTEPPAMQKEEAAPTTPAAPPPAATEPAPAPATPPAADKEAAAPAPATPSADASSSGLKEAQDDKKIVTGLNMPVDQVEEMDIFDGTGKKIAEVDSVLEDSNGEIKGVAIGYGGFLGFGEKGAIVTLDQVKLKDGNLVTELTEDQLPTLPAWND